MSMLIQAGRQQSFETSASKMGMGHILSLRGNGLMLQVTSWYQATFGTGDAGSANHSCTRVQLVFFGFPMPIIPLLHVSNVSW
jgi:hypothetical protein